jgi:hypothetical protein
LQEALGGLTLALGLLLLLLFLPPRLTQPATSPHSARHLTSFSLPPRLQVVLVGDPRQLPPTILSQAPGVACLGQSLFERLHKAGVPAEMLTWQYRCHPAISR